MSQQIVADIPLAERPSREGLSIYPRVDVAPADSFKSIMTQGTGSLQALVNSSPSLQDSIETHAEVIDRVIGQHGGLKTFVASALFESPMQLVALITGDVSLASLFKAQAVAQGLYPGQAVSEHAKNLRPFEIEPAGFR